MPEAALRLFSDQARPVAEPLTMAQETLIGHRYGLVQAWRSFLLAAERAGMAREAATQAFIDCHPGTKRTTLYRWDKLLRDDMALPPERRQSLRVLLDRRSLRGCGKAERAAQDDPGSPAWKLFKTLYNAMPPQTVVTCWHIVKAEADKNGWAWPSLRTVQLRVTDQTFQVRNTFFRLGEREWTRRYGHQIPRPLHEYRAGQHLMSDFHEAHQFCRRSDSDPRPVRPLIAATQDIRSRMCALHVCTAENQREVLASLAKWIREHGCPEEWTIDNGKPYRSLGISGGRQTARRIENEDYVRSVAGQLGIAVHFSIAFNPNGKTYAERLFSTIEQQVRFPGWCGSEQDDVFRAAHKLAQDHPERLPTVAEYAAAIDRWTRVYHATPHGGECMNGLSPAQAFDAFNPIPKTVAPEGVLDMLLQLTATAKVSNMGVLYKGVRYSNYEGLFDHMGKKVLLRIPETDAGRVTVCDLKTGVPICEAVNARLQITGTGHEHVAEGMRRKNRAKKLMKQVRNTDLHAANRDVVENALAARAAEVEAASSHRATGTDGPSAPARNLRPLRGDIVEKLAAYQGRKQSPPSTLAQRENILDVLAAAYDREEAERAAQSPPYHDLLSELYPLDDEPQPVARPRRSILERLADD